MKRKDFYTRRQILHQIIWSGAGALAMVSVPWGMIKQAKAQTAQLDNKERSKERIIKISKSDQEWEKELSSQEYSVLREEGTERPFTSPLLKEHRKGVFACAGCGLPLFQSDTKYDSGTGWPSFYQAIDGHVETKTDFKLVVPRTEYHCARCDGHQGHVFEDGPAPTGLRYCNNGVSLKFIPEGQTGEEQG